ncbi:MAG: hypothetical protein IJ717_00150 [Treponema sp.]|nr:hypothetical protein [Treponema sp.]
MAVSYQPIEGSDWTAVCLAPYDDFYHGITVLMYAMIGIAIAALITACVVGLVVVKLSIKPLKSVSARKINETGTTLNAISGQVKESIIHIGTQVDQFKV